MKMSRMTAKALVASSLLLATHPALAAGSVGIETHDCCISPGFPDTETFTYRHGAVVAQLRFDPARSARLRSVTMRCQGRTRSFQIEGDYFALWNRPLVRIGAGYPEVRFTLPVSASRTATSPDHVLTVECQSGRITEWLQE